MALQLGTCFTVCTAYCCCTSLCSSSSCCCGRNNNHPDETTTTGRNKMMVGPTSGRKRSVILLFISIMIQFIYQYGISDYILNHLSTDHIIYTAWVDGCYTTSNNNTISMVVEQSCVGNAGNYRVASMTTFFFLCSAMIVACCIPTANREYWGIKIILYIVLLLSTIVIPNEPYFVPIYRSIAIVGGVIFICLQQFIILDCSYSWNDSWVEKSNQAEIEESGSGKKWLMYILLWCAVFVLGTIAALIYMFIEYTGCPTNNAFIAVTFLFCLLLVLAQLSGGEGSLLSVACISAWCAYLCYTAVTKNPDESCNPRLGETSPIGIAIGLIITLLSLGWTGWSYTAEDKLSNNTHDETNVSKSQNNAIAVSSSDKETDIEENTIEPKQRDVTGVVVVATESNATDDNVTEGHKKKSNPTESISSSSNSWKLNIVLAVVSCWSAMILTQWGAVQANDGTIANRDVGHVGMWVIIGSQWFVMSLYLWTLIAPRLFPNRDFS